MRSAHHDRETATPPAGDSESSSPGLAPQHDQTNRRQLGSLKAVNFCCKISDVFMDMVVGMNEVEEIVPQSPPKNEAKRCLFGLVLA